MNKPLALDDVLYFSSVNFNGYQNRFWQSVYADTSEGGRFFIDLARRLNPNRFVTRDSSEWTLPWPQEMIPKYKMVAYDADFAGSFSEVSDTKAQDFKRRINTNGERFAIMYSGGIDSTVIMAALIKNLTEAELKNITVCTSLPAVVENPQFWKKYIWGKFKIIDSMSKKYHDLIEAGYTPVTADDGDCIHGTVFGLNVYHNWESLVGSRLSESSRNHIAAIMPGFSDANVHFSEFKDLLIAYMQYPANQKFPLVPIANPDPNFGRRLYDKFARNAETATVPVNSLHDFFWWLIFNVKMLNCGVRGALYYNDRIAPEQAIHAVENWYLDPGYQSWSMVNNNNGEKIGHSSATYKKAARDYIWDLDRNDWYRSFKLKLESMALNTVRQTIDQSHMPRPSARFGITKNYEFLDIMQADVQHYIQHHLANYKIDWSE
jgi:hypothetical protein